MDNIIGIVDQLTAIKQHLERMQQQEATQKWEIMPMSHGASQAKELVGWEPFSVTEDRPGNAVVWWRRRKIAP